MAAEPVRAPYTAREVACGGYVATALWLLSGVLLATLVVWCA